MKRKNNTKWKERTKERYYSGSWSYRSRRIDACMGARLALVYTSLRRADYDYVFDERHTQVPHDTKHMYKCSYVFRILAN